MDSGVVPEKLPLGWLIPGLAYILVIDILAVTGLWESLPWFKAVWSFPLIAWPWLMVAFAPRRLMWMGFHRRRWLASFGWGVVAGGVWRAASLAFNLLWTGAAGNLLGWGELFSALLVVPWIEETFFRGFLGRGLIGYLGRWPAIFAQAVLFSLHPIHWAQGSFHLVSIFIFGLIAGWLVEKFDSIWAAWGSHAFANLIPLALRYIV